MKLNRRSVLGAIGMIGVGTGAAFGSGAFTTVEAQREVEVNVLGGDNGISRLNPNGDEDAGNLPDAIQEQENELADNITGNFADVLVDTSSDNIAVKDGNGTFYDGEELFPVGSDTYTNVDENYVSLVANDVTIVFGPDGNKLPSNAILTQNDLFALVSDGNFDVAFSSENATNARLITNIGGEAVEDTGTTPTATGTVNGGTTLLDTTVDTGETATETEDLTIEITEN
ncbi:MULTISPECIES: hypothetical protein [unclassified Halorubrum]|uniref:hypothetical protein n=1 Tax=unclassified Halorubrum TaxID=2642239 RepID=UPI0010F5E861|nr:MULTISPECIES: hypothetical protein [unclassified Halorubrum]TKX45036.1 hypothetical protein EXE50_03410 [Halorubrum sp. ARQ200]TKX48818.1 hypothetical protein EXE49_15180 [Halorubrum sp. ASP121]